MSDYLPIADHGLIGDLHSVALVGTNGTIDWYCCPRFDSPSVFGSILDARRGGCYRLRRVPESVIAYDGRIPYLQFDPVENWRDNFSTYDLRW